MFGGKASREIRRRGVEEELATGEQLPLPSVVPAEELSAHLEIVLALVPCEVVAAADRVLEEFLRVVAALPDD